MKNIKIRKKVRGFTLIELLIVIAIIGVLAGLLFPAVNRARIAGQRIQSVNKVKNIVLGLRTFSSENDTFFPTTDFETGNEFADSVEAFNTLIPDIINTEQTFWIRTDDKPQAPEENNLLEADECVYGYVTGQNEGAFSLSPLVFESFMSAPGIVTADHIWLSTRKLVVGYVDGHVEQNQLTSATEGATVMSTDRRVENIFEERQDDGAGQVSGGYLATESDNVLFVPE